MSSFRHHSKRINRADLLQNLILFDEEALRALAELSCYQAPERKIELVLPDIEPEAVPVQPPPPEEPDIEPDEATHEPIHYYRVVKRVASDVLPEPENEEYELPEWYPKIPALDLDSVEAADVEPPTKEPLVRWAKLWPVLQRLLSEIKHTRQVDTARLIKQISQAEIPNRIPQKSRAQWAASVQVIVERPSRTELFNDDYNQLLDQLKQLRGTTGLKVLELIDLPKKVIRIRKGERYQTKQWRMPEPETKVFILSDLGLLDSTGKALEHWLIFGKQLARLGHKPMALVPLASRYLTAEVIATFDCVQWTRNSPLNITQWATVTQKAQRRQAEEDLLAWLSPAVTIEPALLRAVRHRLPALKQDVGTEAACWLSDDVVPSSVDFYFKAKSVEKHRERFKQLATEQPQLANTIVKLLRDYHRHVFPTQLHEEMLILANLMGEHLDPCYQEEVEAATLHWQQLLKALKEKAEGGEGLEAFTEDTLARQHSGIWRDKRSAHLPAMLGVLMSSDRQSAHTLPDYLVNSPESMQLFMQFYNQKSSQTNTYLLCQKGSDTLSLLPKDSALKNGSDFSQGVPLAEFNVRSSYALNQQHLEEGGVENKLVSLDELKPSQCFYLAGEEVHIERLTKPDWAMGVGYDAKGLYAETQNQDGDIYRWYWNPPIHHSNTEEFSSEDQIKYQNQYSGFWYQSLLVHPRMPQLPQWADVCIRDEVGLKAQVTLNGIEQWFRWIEPTTFRMGSPETENGRYERETQHLVTLTQGYWLADTACTQALWQAVMGDNPSYFKAENKPVEQVSWDDVQDFLSCTYEQYPLLNLRLPSEAEWENACRAGSTSAFNFNQDLSLKDVNYRGNWDDYEGWGEGALRATSGVKDYPPNAWGLYEMHGNVMEWCEDWFESFNNKPVIDPEGPVVGDNRVLRGGSWVRRGRLCRSAFRNRGAPTDSDFNFGFRLARSDDNSPIRGYARVGDKFEVFISYAKHVGKSSVVAKTLYRYLRKRNISVFFDEKSIGARDDWLGETKSALSESKIVLVIVSDSVFTPLSEKEINEVKSKGKIIIPVWVGVLAQPFPLQDITGVNLSGGEDTLHELTRLYEGISEHLGNYSK